MQLFLTSFSNVAYPSFQFLAALIIINHYSNHLPGSSSSLGFFFLLIFCCSEYIFSQNSVRWLELGLLPGNTILGASFQDVLRTREPRCRVWRSPLCTGLCGALGNRMQGCSCPMRLPGSSFATGNTESLSLGSAGHGDCCCYATMES